MNIFIHSCHTAYTMPLLVAMETVVMSILAHSQSVLPFNTAIHIIMPASEYLMMWC